MAIRLEDLFNTGVSIGDWWQRRDSIGESADLIGEGFDQGRDDVKQYADPWVDAGLEALGGYQNLGEFDYTHGDYLDSDAFEFQRDMGQRGLERLGAKTGKFNSGNLAGDISRYNVDYAGTKYEEDYRRQLDAYDSNKDYYRLPMELGQDSAKFAGQYLSDMAIGKGSSLASLEAAKAQNLSNLLGLWGGDNPRSGGAPDGSGSFLESLPGWLEDIFGGGASGEGVPGGDDNRPYGWGDNLDDIFDIITGSQNTGANSPTGDPTVTGGTGGVDDQGLLGNAGWVMRGGKWVYDAATAGAAAEAGTTVGAGTAAGGAEAGVGGAAGWGATAMAATPLLAFGAIIALDQLMGRGEQWAAIDQLKDLKKSHDPLQNIAEMKDMTGILDSSYRRGQYTEAHVDAEGKDVGGKRNYSPIQAQRGSMYNLVFSGMSPEQAAEFANYGTPQNRQNIINSMVSFVQSDAKYNSKLVDSAGNKWDGLANIFPEVSQEDWKYFSQYESAKANGTLNEYAGDYGTTEFWGNTYQRHGSVQEATDRVNDAIDLWTSLADLGVQ